jgi:hypothetical protein
MFCLRQRRQQTWDCGRNANSSKNMNSGEFHEDTEKEMPMKFSLAPLLVANKDISAEARKALVENRPRDAAVILMEQNGLTCVEAGQLLDVSAC